MGDRYIAHLTFNHERELCRQEAFQQHAINVAGVIGNHDAAAVRQILETVQLRSYPGQQERRAGGTGCEPATPLEPGDDDRDNQREQYAQRKHDDGVQAEQRVQQTFHRSIRVPNLCTVRSVTGITLCKRLVESVKPVTPVGRHRYHTQNLDKSVAWRRAVGSARRAWHDAGFWKPAYANSWPAGMLADNATPVRQGIARPTEWILWLAVN